MTKVVPIEHARAQRLLTGLNRLEREGAAVVPLKTTVGFNRAEAVVRAIKEALPVLGEDQTKRVCEATLRELCRT
jgi:methylphosphotriester-DNA--protein-cysteine methyltransferase